MTITLNVPTDVEALLRAQAKAAGMEVEEYSARLLGQMLRSLPTETPSDMIRVDEKGVAWIIGTATKVVEIVGDLLYDKMTAEESAQEHPHLNLLQVQAALDYYQSHKEEIEADMERRLRYAEEMRAQSPPRWTREELEERRNRKREEKAAK